MVRNETVAEDLTMEVLEKAVNRIDSFTSDYKLSTWLFTIARNHVIDYKRTQDIRPAATVELEKVAMLRTDTPDPLQVLISQEETEKIERCIDRLSDKSKTVIRLHIDGYKDEQIAEETGISYTAVRSLLCRARKQIKEAVI